MKNKVRLKKYLAIISIISICILSLFLVIRVLEYKTYTNNFNNKLDMIIGIGEALLTLELILFYLGDGFLWEIIMFWKTT